eukprot:CAMPEP_0182858474 /NCGR_PEP_ID=MMETSP0034_2-20130328/3698_1 /TAXON_ID=156128 /ORGANISM="Nephroselmis pyriformis, Strain CCMP717" /LENGTH=52 /DNA_ID=CAMNT_0024989907 /DNA_START=388 /DNA_END=546 /DNA_ORIENTATION=-
MCLFTLSILPSMSVSLRITTWPSNPSQASRTLSSMSRAMAGVSRRTVLLATV